MKSLPAIFALCLFGSSATLAEDVKPFNSQLLFIRNHFGIVFGPTLLFAGQTKISGAGNFNIRYVPGAFFGLRYRHNFDDRFAITSGAHFGLHPLNYRVSNKDGNSYKGNVTLPFLNVPITFLGRIKMKPKSFLNVEFGMNINYYFPGSVSRFGKTGYDLTQDEYFSLSLRFDDKKPLVNFNFGLAYAAVLKNLNMLEFGVRYNLGKRKFLKGEYTFSEDNVVVENGTVYSKSDYLALEITYVFTRAWSILN